MSRKDKKVFAIIVGALVITLVGGFLLISYMSDRKDNENNSVKTNSVSDKEKQNIVEDTIIDNDNTIGGFSSEKVNAQDEIMITDKTLPSNNTSNAKID